VHKFLPDRDLSMHLDQAVKDERQATTQLVALLMEVDARRLYIQQGCASLFSFCVQALHLAEGTAYLQVEAARAARRFPVILERIADGSLHLATVSLIAPLLTEENHLDVLSAAVHKNRHDVQQLVEQLTSRHVLPAHTER
jgi:hypothetical protein